MSRIKKGDTVQVLSGKDRGKKGKIMKIFPASNTALVERMNLVKHFEKRSQANQNGGVVEKESPYPIAKLALVCSRCSRAVRVGFLVGEDGSKQRICKRCREVLGG